MALILAIEPDRRQAGQLTALVKGRLHAEVVIGDSAETALAALGSRVPDLVLTTALLSPRDESALAERLRGLNGAAAHVQMLTIPVLAAPSRRTRVVAKAGGVLSALLGDKGEGDESSTADGCDPAMFAEQCREYLDRAAADRAVALEERHLYAEPLDTTSFAEQTAVKDEPAVVELTESMTDVAAQTEFYEQAPPGIAPDSAASPNLAPVDVVEPVVVESSPRPSRHRGFMTQMSDDEPPAGLLAAVAAFADEDESPAFAVPEPTVFTEEIAAEPEQIAVDPDELSIPTYDLTAGESGADDDSQLREFTKAFAVESVRVESVTEVAAEPVGEAAVDPDVEAVVEPTVEAVSEPAVEDAAAPTTVVPARAENRTWPILEDIASGLEAQTTTAAEPVAVSAPARTEFDGLQDWKDIIEALRRDTESISSPVVPSTETVQNVQQADEPEVAAAAPAVSPVVDPAPLASPDPSGPPEDEWGFFDPDRAGFAALLAKLEQITDDDARKTQRT